MLYIPLAFSFRAVTDYNTVEIWPLKNHQEEVVAMLWAEDTLVVRDSEQQQGVAVVVVGVVGAVEGAVGDVNELFLACWLCRF
jgi:hypothetical protein